MRTRLVLLPAAVGFAVLLAGCGSGGDSSSSTTAASTTAASTTAASASASQSTVSSPSSASAPSSRTSSPASSTGGSATSSPATAGGRDFDIAAAEGYCVREGGTVQPRQAYWGTNGDEADWLALGGSTEMCRFQTDDEAKSRIYVDLVTLTSKEPTLAGLAYLAQIPMPSVTGGANPATGYCSKELGGSSTFGAVGAAGGGWVAKDDPDDVVVALCVFPDQSFIDEWGLAYHSNGEVRGKDLTTVMQYQTAELPPVFPEGTNTGSTASTGAPGSTGTADGSSGAVQATSTTVAPTS